MKRLTKENLIIVQESKNDFKVYVRKKVLLVFNTWEPITMSETEYSEEKPISFTSFEEAETFIDFLVHGRPTYIHKSVHTTSPDRIG